LIPSLRSTLQSGDLHFGRDVRTRLFDFAQHLMAENDVDFFSEEFSVNISQFKLESCVVGHVGLLQSSIGLGSSGRQGIGGGWFSNSGWSTLTPGEVKPGHGMSLA